MRLKRNGKVLGTLTPADFFTALARRANALNLLYCDGQPAVDESDVATLAATLLSEPPQLRRVHVTRYSARQRRHMQWPGLMGILRWRGPALTHLWPLLRFGEQAQIGKGTTFGFGRYRLIPSDRPR